MPIQPPAIRRAVVRVVLSATAILLVLTGCGPGGGTTPDPAPTVESTTPADGATNVSIGSTIAITFSEAMDPATTEAAFAVSPAVTCTFSWNPADTTVTCDPDADLAADQSYTVTIGAGAESDAGQPLGTAASFSFSTGATVTELCTFGSSTFGACRFGP
jgi:hypothetical protein